MVGIEADMTLMTVTPCVLRAGDRTGSLEIAGDQRILGKEPALDRHDQRPDPVV